MRRICLGVTVVGLMIALAGCADSSEPPTPPLNRDLSDSGASYGPLMPEPMPTPNMNILADQSQTVAAAGGTDVSPAPTPGTPAGPTPGTPAPGTPATPTPGTPPATTPPAELPTTPASTTPPAGPGGFSLKNLITGGTTEPPEE